jgi:hypothetical protein
MPKPKFRLRDSVRRIGHLEARTVEEIREAPASETLYSIQLGRDFATRVWAKESEVEPATFNIHLCNNGKEFKVLPAIADREGVSRPGAGETMNTGPDGEWRIIGVRNESSIRDHIVDVERI